MPAPTRSAAYHPDEDQGMSASREFYESATEHQLDFFPSHLMRGLVDEMDHQVAVIADTDPHALETVEPSRIMRRGEAMKPLLDWRGEKENEGRFSWTLGLYGTEAMAAEAGMGLEEYWQQIIQACFLDEEDPIARWREVGRQLDQARERLDGMDIERVHVEGDGRRPVGDHRRAAALARRPRPQHPQLRAVHQPRLARDGGLDPLRPAALPLRQAWSRASGWPSPTAA